VNRLIIICFLLSKSLISQSQATDTTKARFFADSAWKAYQSHYFKSSIRLLDSAIFYGSNKSASYHLKSEAQWFLGWYAEAAETFKNIISIGDSNLLRVSAYVFLGMLYDKAENPADAKKQYASAISLWENGYVPIKQFQSVEESDYFLALAFLEEKEKAMKLMDERSLDSLPYPKRIEFTNRYRTYRVWFGKDPKKLLNEHFQEYMLPGDIKPLEE